MKIFTVLAAVVVLSLPLPAVADWPEDDQIPTESPQSEQELEALRFQEQLEQADNYLRKAELFLDAEEYVQAVDMYKLCYANTHLVKCIKSFDDTVTSFNNDMIDIANKHNSGFDAKMEENKKYCANIYKDQKYYYWQEVYLPDSIFIYKKQYNKDDSDIKKIQLWIKSFNTMKYMFNTLKALSTECARTSQEDENICLKVLSGLNDPVKDNLDTVYTFIVDTGFVSPILYKTWNTITKAYSDSFFTDQDLMREAGTMLGQLDFSTVKTCSQSTREMYAEVITLFKKEASSKLFDEFKLLHSVQDNINSGRTGTELWWSE